MGRTTIGLHLIELIRVGKAQKGDILASLEARPEGAERLRVTSEPRARVRLSELRGGSERIEHSEQIHRVGAGRRVEGVYDEVKSMDLYDLSASGRLDVIRVGRHPEQDLQILDPIVSREHGLIILAQDTVLYCDYGTLRDDEPGVAPSRTGSMNGTYIDGHILVRDAMVTWLPGQSLMLGKFLKTHEGDAVTWFKLDYQFIERDDGLN